MPLMTRIIKPAGGEQTASAQRRFTIHGSTSVWRMGTSHGWLARHSGKPGSMAPARRPRGGRS